MEKTNPKTGYKQKKMNLTIYQIDNIMTQEKKLILEHCTSTTHLRCILRTPPPPPKTAKKS